MARTVVLPIAAHSRSLALCPDITLAPALSHDITLAPELNPQHITLVLKWPKCALPRRLGHCAARRPHRPCTAIAMGAPLCACESGLESRTAP